MNSSLTVRSPSLDHSRRRSMTRFIYGTLILALASIAPPFAQAQLHAAPGAVPIPTPRSNAKIPARVIDPDFAAMALSPEEEEKLIQGPARIEIRQPPPTPPTRPTTPKRPEQPMSDVKKPNEPVLVNLALSGRTSLADLCRQLPTSEASATSYASGGLSLSHLTRLLRGVWSESGLLDAGAGEHLVRLTISDAQVTLLSQIFTQQLGELHEEDLPELMDTSMTIVHSMEVEREAAAQLHAYRTQMGIDLDDAPPPQPSIIWKQLSRFLSLIHLHPGMAEEYDAFWAFLVGLGLCVASIGLGFAWGVRSDRKSMIGSVDAQIRQGLDGGGSTDPNIRTRRRSPRQLFCANFCWVLFWIFLACVLLFFIGYIHLFLEIQNENRALAAVAKSKPVPRACVMTPEEFESSQSFGSRLLDVAKSFSPFIPRLQHAKDSDPCVKYWQDYNRSITPNPAFVLSQFLSRMILDPFVMFMGAFGEGLYQFLGHHSFLSQLLILTFVGLTLIGLAWTGGLGALWCCFCRGGNNGGNSSRYRHRSPGLGLRESEERRYYLESGTDESEREEEEAIRRRLKEERNNRRRLESGREPRSGKRESLPRLKEGGHDSYEEEEEESDVDLRRRQSSDGRREKSARRHHSRSRGRSRSRSHERDPSHRSGSSSASRDRDGHSLKSKKSREESVEPSFATTSSAPVNSNDKLNDPAATHKSPNKKERAAAAAAAAQSPPPDASLIEEKKDD